MNSFSFHNSIKNRKINISLSSLFVERQNITDKALIEDHVVNFYSSLFNRIQFLTIWIMQILLIYLQSFRSRWIFR